MKLIPFATLATGLLLSLTLNAYGMGKGSNTSGNNSCSPTALGPIRPVIIKPTSSRPFPLPNGSTIDMTPHLDAIATTAVMQTGVFARIDEPSETTDPCASHLEIRSAISTLEMNLYELGIKVGYTPDNVYGISEVNGEAKVKIGALSLDVSVWKCSASGCISLLATAVNQTAAEGDLSFTVDFGLITTGAEFVTHSSFNNLLRKMMNTAASRLASSADFNKLPWFATVREAKAGQSSFTLDAGSSSNIQLKQNLVVYQVTPTTGVCKVYKALAYAHTTQVDPVSAIATIDEIRSADANIQPGDIVMVKAK